MASKSARPLRELSVGLLALGVGVLITALVVWLNLGLVERAVVRDREASDIVVQADALMESMLDQETGLRGYVISADPAFLEPYGSGRRRMNASLRALSSLTAGHPDQRARVAQVAGLATDWTETVARPQIEFVRRGARAQAQAVVTSGAGRRRMDAIRVALGEVRR